MPWLERISEPQDLRRCIRNLVALSTLATTWQAYDPSQISDSVANALLSLLSADFAYVSLPGRRDERPIETTRTNPRIAADVVAAIRTTLGDAWPGRPSEQSVWTTISVGEETVHLAAVPVGVGIYGEAVIMVGSSRPYFPTETERVLLEVGASEATIALQRWYAEREARRFVTLVERSSDFIGFASLRGRPQYINPAGLKLVGLTGVKQAHRLHIFDFLVPEEQRRAREELWPILLRTGRWNGELSFRHFKTGERMPFLLDCFQIDDPRTMRPMNIATVSRDLSSQKRSEAELRRLNEALEQRVSGWTAELADASEKLVKEISERQRTDARFEGLQSELFHAARLSAAGQMAAALAHELNQPLTAVTNSVNAARRLLAKREPEAIALASEVMAEAADQTLRAGKIIVRLREFVARGETEKRFETLSTMIEEATALALTGSGALSVQVSYRFDPNVSLVFANRVQIQQVIVNLVRNALDAMATSRRRDLEVITKKLDAQTVEVAVADSGRGLADEIRPHLFEPFVSTRRDGMGLGLSICRSIIDAHGGRIYYDEKIEGGTTFRFTLAGVPANAEDDHS